MRDQPAIPGGAGDRPLHAARVGQDRQEGPDPVRQGDDTYDHALAERAHAMPSGVCLRCRDLKARMDRELHDPAVSATFTAFSWVLQDMIEAQGLTVPEMAEKTSINERRLNTEVRSGIIGLTHLDDLFDVQGHGWSAIPTDLGDLCRDGQRHIRTIEAMRRGEAAR